MSNAKAKNTVCLWFNKDGQDAARFLRGHFLPDSEVTAICKAPGDYPSGKEGDILTVEFTVCGIPCLGINGGPQFSQTEAFSFQIATDTQEETDRYWNAIVSNGGEESACGWCKDRWGKRFDVTLGVSWKESSKAYVWGEDQTGRLIPLDTKAFLEGKS